MEEQKAFCPATMCPLFARECSPWTGEKNAECGREKCGFFHDCGKGKSECNGKNFAIEQIYDENPMQIGTVRPKRGESSPRSYDCPRAHDCQWQLESDYLCPPRLALSLGIDPKKAAY